MDILHPVFDPVEHDLSCQREIIELAMGFSAFFCGDDPFFFDAAPK